MSAKKSIYGTMAQLLRGGSRSSTPLPHNNHINTKKEIAMLTPDTTTQQQYLQLKDVPGPWPSIPFIGTSWQYFPGSRYSLSKLHEANEDKYRRYGSIVKEEFQWGKPVVHLFNPDDFETVFRYQGRHPLRPISDFVVHYRRNRPEKYDSPGLANSLGEEWARLRKAVSPVLVRTKSVNFLIENVNRIGDDFVKLLKAARHPETLILPDTQDMTYKLALEAVYMMSLDTRLGSLEVDLQEGSPASDMIVSVKLLFESFQELFYGLPLWKLFETASYKKLDAAESIMYEATSKTIQEAVEKLRNSETTEENTVGVLQTLIEQNKLSDKELIVTVIDLIAGGIFTVANSLTFLLYHISRNPQVQEKLYEELKEHIPDSEVTLDGLREMPYLKACVQESFRLTPTIPCINRTMPEDVILSGYHIPKGVTVFCHFPIPCKQADVFPEPKKFYPERWLDRSLQNHNTYTLMPFGFGSRMCLGKRFAEMELYTALAKMVYNFKIEPSGGELDTKSAFIVVPSSPVALVLRDRH